MSKQDSQRQRPPAGEAPMMSKAERRAAGKLAARKRAAAKRRKRALQNASVALAGIAVVVVLVLVFGGFGSDDTGSAAGAGATETSDANTAPATAPTAPTAVPSDLDPALRTKPEVKAGTGDLTELKVTTLVAGKGAAVQAGQTISVNYVGVGYATGEEFDSSWKTGQPISFPIGQGGVIVGWDEGLVGVAVGSRVQLDIPADKAYGENPGQGYPAGDLRFVVDILAAT